MAGVSMDAALDELRAVLADGVRTRVTDRVGYASDASHYLLTPSAVVSPRGAGELSALLAACDRHGLGLTFRSGGTSLSGQAITDRLLVDTRRHFREVEIVDGGARVRVQPGVTLRQVNARLTRFGRRLGPDPASEAACTIGGVIADNSSGMTCGTTANAYTTLESVTFVLADGTVFDTGVPDADDRLRAVRPDLHAGLLRLRDRVRGNPRSVATIRRQFSMKNTMGYGLNAFLDHDTPAEILAHLLVGSEGTLAFVAEAVLRTVPLLPSAATGLLLFENLADATTVLPELVAAGPAAIELLDAASLRVAATDPQAGTHLRGLSPEQQAALLVEWQETEPDLLRDRLDAARPVLARMPLIAPADIGADAATRAALWHVRKGLYAAVAGRRPTGTTALLEDVAVPVETLAGTCAELARLVAAHGYGGTVVFGHAKDGNLHFMLTESFADEASVRRYAAFTNDLVDLILGNGGTLKAEHGTGRTMAPFVRRQYGDELYAVMRELKGLCDPTGILNPGVLLTEDDRAHLRHLKVVPTVEPEVDRCVECGYCEPVCPSRDLTTTPRQRIVLRRAMRRAEQAGDLDELARLRDEYGYDAVETCAVDGMCAEACPVHINTGDLTKRLRGQATGPVTRAGWRTAAGHWGATTAALGRALDVAAAMPPAVPGKISDLARSVLGDERVPRWRRDLPRGGRRRAPRSVDRPDAIYLPSCLGTMFAPAAGGAGVRSAVETLAARAGVRLLVPPEVASLCCAVPWSSKGLSDGYDRMAGKVADALAVAADGVDLDTVPVISDAASCSEGLHRLLAGLGRTTPVTDVIQFVAERILPRLDHISRVRTLALHPTCSSRRMKLDDAIMTVAQALADEVVIPDNWQCCAFAGDRGLLHPELTASATAAEAAEVSARAFDAYASVNRTCEIGMTRATGKPYRHLLELLADAVPDGSGS